MDDMEVAVCSKDGVIVERIKRLHMPYGVEVQWMSFEALSKFMWDVEHPVKPDMQDYSSGDYDALFEEAVKALKDVC